MTNRRIRLAFPIKLTVIKLQFALGVICIFSVLCGCRNRSSEEAVSNVKAFANCSGYSQYTTCIGQGNDQKWSVCRSDEILLKCDSCIRDRDQMPEGYDPQQDPNTGYYHDYTSGCVEVAASEQPSPPDSPPTNTNFGGSAMVFGYNIHDVHQHHFYRDKMGDGLPHSYKEAGKTAYMLQVAYSTDAHFTGGKWQIDKVNDAINLVAEKNDRLVVRLDYSPGNSNPSPENRQRYIDVIDSLLAESGIAYVQVGNEPNLKGECNDSPEHCRAEAYLPFIQRYKSHPKFISAPWTTQENFTYEFSRPWTWATTVLSGNCPVNIGIHAYPALANNDRAATFAMELLGLNMRFIHKLARCHNSNIFITEANGNMGGDAAEWVAAIKAARTGVNWVNAKLGRKAIKGVLLFTLGQEGTTDAHDQMSRFMIAVDGRAQNAIWTAKHCGNPDSMPEDCIDNEIAEDFAKIWNLWVVGDG